MYKQNRYQVPKGTYTPGREVKLILNSTKINILDIKTDELIVSHQLSTKQDELVKIIHPERDIHNTIDTIYKKGLLALVKLKM